VRFAASQGCELAQLSLEQLRGFAAQIDADALPALSLEGSVAARDHLGGTAPAQVERQVAWWQAKLAAADDH
jgi:argininosuccinate lyase